MRNVYPAVIMFVLVAGAAQATPPTFTGVGDLAGGLNYSQLTRVSADGTTAVGTSNQGLYRAIRWRAGTGLEDLGSIDNTQSDAYGVSANGNVVSLTGGPGDTPCLWTQGAGFTNQGSLGGSFAVAYDVSDDGTVATGMAATPSSGNRAYRWTQATGMVALPLPPGATASIALSISGDGSTIVGGGGINAGFRWTQANGWQSLGHLPGGPGTSVDAVAVSYDASWIVGASDSGIGDQAFRWNPVTGMQALGDLPGGAVASRAFGVSNDGSVVVGRGITDMGTEAFLWTPTNGMQNLKTLLLSWGVSAVANWHLSYATDVSGDGTVIVGNGIDPQGNQQGWVVTIPAPSGLLPVSATLFLSARRRRPI